MANFYTDNPDLKHHLSHPLMQKIVELKERNYTEAEKFDYAPLDFEDAMDNYDKVLEIIGDICGNIIAENAEGVDHQGPRVENGRVIYADGTKENLEACRKAGLMGMAMPRRFGGLNFPITPYIMAADIVSRADAGFENLWGLQDCAETLYEFGDEDQKQRFLTRVCAGETMSMDLTEPDAGSDLQSVMLKATPQEDGTWLLNGVKRFITNGDSDIHLVLARSEEGTKDGRGLSMFIYDNDVVEAVNMSGQLYGNSDLGLNKVAALSNMISNYANYSSVFAINERFTAESEASDIMICGFDNMAARKLFFEKWVEHVMLKPEEDRANCLFIDGRLAAEEFQVLCIKGDDGFNINRYRNDFLFSDVEADETICSYKQTTFCANMIASYMVNLFVNFCANQCNPIIDRDLPFFTTYNAETMYLKTEV